MTGSDGRRYRIETFIRTHDLIERGGDVCCFVSGGADSTCLWHALGALGYRVSAVHVNHKLRGEESDEDARFCADVLGAEVVELFHGEDPLRGQHGVERRRAVALRE